MKTNGHKGFTLIELLVVIAIVALLLSIIVPSLAQVKEKAKSVTCRSQQRQLIYAMRMYVDGNNDRTMPFSNAVAKTWYSYLSPYLGITDDPAIGNNEGVLKVMRCPATKLRTEPKTPEHDVHYRGAADLCYRWNAFQEASIGINQWILPEFAPGQGGLLPEWQTPDGKPNSNFYFRYSETSGRTPVFSDSIWVSTWPDSTDVPPTDLYSPPTPHAIGYFMNRVCVDRHQMAINVSFADGHVDKSPLADLWMVSWHRNFKFREVTIRKQE